MSETNHTNARAQAPLKPGRRFPVWTFGKLNAIAIQQSGETCIYARIDNCLSPRDPTLYYVEITRAIRTESGARHESLVRKPFNDIIEALLYLESVDLSDYETTNE